MRGVDECSTQQTMAAKAPTARSCRGVANARVCAREWKWKRIAGNGPIGVKGQDGMTGKNKKDTRKKTIYIYI